jgi:hypothetical protein
MSSARLQKTYIMDMSSHIQCLHSSMPMLGSFAAAFAVPSDAVSTDARDLD